MREIYLHGAAGRAHGRRWRLDVASPAEAVRALITLRPQLRAVFRQGNWRVIVGRPHIRNAIDGACLGMNMGSQPLHIVPATGARGGIGDIAGVVVGVVLIGAAIVLSGGTLAAPLAGLGATAFSVLGAGVTYGTLVAVGVGLVATGIAGLLTPNPQAQDQATDMARPEDRPSFFFNGVTNNTQQGGPVPLVFGTHLVGSIVISGSLTSEDIAV